MTDFSIDSITLGVVERALDWLAEAAMPGSLRYYRNIQSRTEDEGIKVVDVADPRAPPFAQRQ